MSLSEKLKFLWQIYNFRLLIKDLMFLIGFSLLSILGGFSLPNIKIYELINRTIISKTIHPEFIVGILILVLFLNLLVVNGFLRSKYALRKQSIFASIIIFFFLSITAFSGFWIRILIEDRTLKDEILLKLVDSSNIRLLPPSQLSAAIAVSFTVTLFSFAYTLAIGPGSKVDYFSFQAKFKYLINMNSSIKEMSKKELSIMDQSREFTKLIDEIISLIGDTLLYDTTLYADFVRTYIHTPMKEIQKHLNRYNNNYDVIKEIIGEAHLDMNIPYNKHFMGLLKIWKWG